MRHPAHDQLADTVLGWYTASAPEMGYLKEPRRFGIYGRNPHALDVRGNEVLIRDLPAAQMPAFLADVRAYFAGAPVHLYLDNRASDVALGPALRAAGCSWAGAQSYLAHVGSVPAAHVVPGLTMEAVDEATLAAFAVTKLKGFANSEEEPDAASVQAEVAMRRAELADVGRFLLARMDGEPAATFAWYEDSDLFIYNLATRVPYRHRGIARWLLSDFLAQSYARGCRSVIINADTADTPIQLYRRLGFTDEIYWRGRYDLPVSASTPQDH